MEGWIKLHRRILHSSIFLKKAEYLKIFIYILLKVNHIDGLFEKGSNFFNFKDEIRNIPGVSLNQVYEFIRWAKKEGILTTQKTTRGVVIKINNWNIFQDSKQSELQNNSRFNTNSTTTELRQDSNTINKNKKNVNNEKMTITKGKGFSNLNIDWDKYGKN